MKEAAALQKIQGEQSKALDQITIQKNYPAKTRDLIVEIKDMRDKNKYLEERLRTYEDQRKKGYQEMMNLEDRIKDFKTRIGAY